MGERSISDFRKLSRQQSQLLNRLEQDGMPVAITAITLWASAMLVHRGRIEVAASHDTWIGELETHPLLAILPITGRIAAESLRLDESFPKDPIDQNIRNWGKVPLI